MDRRHLTPSVEYQEGQGSAGGPFLGLENGEDVGGGH